MNSTKTVEMEKSLKQRQQLKEYGDTWSTLQTDNKLQKKEECEKTTVVLSENINCR